MEEYMKETIGIPLFVYRVAQLAFETAFIQTFTSYVYIYDNFVLLRVLDYVFDYHVMHKLAHYHRGIKILNMFEVVVNSVTLALDVWLRIVFFCAQSNTPCFFGSVLQDGVVYRKGLWSACRLHWLVVLACVSLLTLYCSLVS